MVQQTTHTHIRLKKAAFLVVTLAEQVVAGTSLEIMEGLMGQDQEAPLDLLDVGVGVPLVHVLWCFQMCVDVCGCVSRHRGDRMHAHPTQPHIQFRPDQSDYAGPTPVIRTPSAHDGRLYEGTWWKPPLLWLTPRPAPLEALMVPRTLLGGGVPRVVVRRLLDCGCCPGRWICGLLACSSAGSRRRRR